MPPPIGGMPKGLGCEGSDLGGMFNGEAVCDGGWAPLGPLMLVPLDLLGGPIGPGLA